MTTTISFALILAALAVWAVLHSVTASLWAKAKARHLLGARTADGTYRLVYNALALVTFLPVMALTSLLPDRPLYSLPPWTLFATVPTQLAALAAIAISLWRVDLPRFIGLRQAARWLRGEPEPRDPPRFVATGVHRWVRHPLYSFTLILIWLSPAMSTNVLAFNLGVTAYFWIGSYFEERKLVLDFGEVYREHQRRVTRLLPFPRPRPRPRQSP